MMSVHQPSHPEHYAARPALQVASGVHSDRSGESSRLPGFGARVTRARNCMSAGGNIPPTRAPIHLRCNKLFSPRSFACCFLSFLAASVLVAVNFPVLQLLLAMYGFLSGRMYAKRRKQNNIYIYTENNKNEAIAFCCSCFVLFHVSERESYLLV